jgi:hypothetical protein
MSMLKKVVFALSVATLLAVPVQTANAWWGGGPWSGPWRHSYVHDPAYRWGPPHMRTYIRNLHLYGPVYADWKQRRLYGW